jgi:hypothetical protein
MKHVLALICLSGCASTPETRLSGPTLELALDEGRPSERPLTPAKTFELLLRVDPKLPSWTPRRLRLLLAQAGHVVFTFYGDGESGRSPGAPLGSLDRAYDPSFTSDGRDGKWVIEELSLPAQRGAIWIGVHSPGGGDPRLWATSNDSGAAFMRDADPTARPERIPRTPVMRLEVTSP